MKFTKNELSEALKAKITNNGKKTLHMSEKSFNSHVERIYRRLEKRESEGELDDIVTDYLEDFESFEGDYRNRDSKHAKEKEDWEKSHKKDDDKPDGKDDDKLEKLLKEINDLKSEREAEKAAKSAAEKKSQLVAKLKEQGVKDEKWLNKYIGKLNITPDTDIEAEATEGLEFYNLAHADTSDVYTPGGTNRPSENDKSNNDDVKSILKRNNPNRQ